MRSFKQGVRLISTTQIRSKQIGSSADFLINLNKGEEPNAEAEKWLEAMKTLREKWAPNGERFNVDEAFAPDGMKDDYDFWAAAEAEIAFKQRKNRENIESNFREVEGVSEEQILEAESLKETDIPPKFDPWMNMLVNQVMRHGEKGVAYKTVNRALYLAYLKLRKDPVAELMAALDKMAPLAQLHRIGDGGARSEILPVPYSSTKRIGLAWKWVVEASQRRPSRDFAVRLGEEIVSAIEGKSPGFEKSKTIHKTAIDNRSIAEEVQQGKWKR